MNVLTVFCGYVDQILINSIEDLLTIPRLTSTTRTDKRRMTSNRCILSTNESHLDDNLILLFNLLS